MFRDRNEAGQVLGRALLHLRNENPIVYGLPRGGVPVAAAVAEALSAPLDVLIVRKIGVPGQPELALGAIADSSPPLTIWNDALVRELQLGENELSTFASRQLEEIERRRKLYLGDRSRPDASGRTAIVVDDGLATGATAKAALRALRAVKPGKIVLAVPVAPPDTLAELRQEADEVVVLEQPDWFPAVGAFYKDFSQTSDEEVKSLLAKAAELQEKRP